MEKLESVQDRVHRLEVELSDREAAHRSMLQQLEQTLAERDHRHRGVRCPAAAQTDELRGAQQTYRPAEQAREVLKEEIRVLREQITQLNEGLADRDELRAQVKKLESARDRVHQLEASSVIAKQPIGARSSSWSRPLRNVTVGSVGFQSRLRRLRRTKFGIPWRSCRTAEQAREVQKEEIRILREQIAQLNEELADRESPISHGETGIGPRPRSTGGRTGSRSGPSEYAPAAGAGPCGT